MAQQRTREAYGIRWPEDLSDLEIELVCYRDNHTPEKGGLGAEGHMRKAIKLLWPDLKDNHWLDSIISAYCVFTEIGATGSASAGKSFGFGLCALVDWLSDPLHTSVVLTSTTVPALRKRIWGDVKKLWISHAGLPGNLVDSSNRLEAFKGNDKSAMFAVAVKDGSVEKAVGNIQGIHNERIIVIIDEMPQTPKAIVTAASNLSKGAKHFRMVGIGNAVSRFDQHGRLCEPIGGWETVNENMPYWLTAGGICLHFDGLQSPNIVKAPPIPVKMLFDSWRSFRKKKEAASAKKRMIELNVDASEIAKIEAQEEEDTKNVPLPETLHQAMMAEADPQEIERAYVRQINSEAEHPYLTTAKQIMDEEQRTSRDSAEWWMYVRGFWPPDGILTTVFSQTMVAKLPSSTLWREEQELLAALDPAFGGGDRCVLKFGRMGIFQTHGMPGIFFGDTVEIRPNVRLTEPIHFQIAERVINECQKRNVRPDCFAMDSTGEGGGLADIISKQWSPKIVRIEFGGSASDMTISRQDRRPARDIYSNKVTELWFTARQFALSMQMANLDDDTATELISRQYVLKGRVYSVEPKIVMKNRTGRSPDLADAAVGLCYLMRLKGVTPGSIVRTSLRIGSGDSGWVEKCREHDVYSR